MRTQITPEQQMVLETTPGRVLEWEFLEPHGLSQAELSRRTGIPKSRITEIIKGRRAITAETAIALSALFGNSAQFWLNLQTGYDLRRAEIEKANEIRARIRPIGAASA